MPKPVITKELLVGFTGKKEPVPGQFGTGGEACFKLLAFDNHELHQDESKWLHWVDTYEIVLLITVRDDNLAPSIRRLVWNRRLVLKSLP